LPAADQQAYPGLAALGCGNEKGSEHHVYIRTIHSGRRNGKGYKKPVKRSTISLYWLLLFFTRIYSFISFLNIYFREIAKEKYK